MIADYFRTENLSKLNTISIDAIIMDNYHNGLEYFSNIIKRFKDKELDINNKVARKYLESYLSTYIEETMNLNEFKDNIENVIFLHQNIIKLKLSNEFIKLWLKTLYNSILELVKNDNLSINFFIELFLCVKFRDYFYLKELNFNTISQESLLYNLIIKTDNFKDIKDIISIFLTNKDYLGNNFIYNWLDKTLIFNNIINNLSDISAFKLKNYKFFLKTFSFIYYIWFNHYKNNDIRMNKNIYYYLIKIIDTTITPIILKITLLENRIDFLSELNNDNILENRNSQYKKFLNEIKSLLKNNKLLFDNIMFFLNYYSIKLIYYGDVTIKKNNDLIDIILFFIYNSKNYITPTHKKNNIILIFKNRLSSIRNELQKYRTLMILFRYSNVSTKLSLLPNLINLFCNNENKLIILEKLNLIDIMINYKNKLVIKDDKLILDILDLLNDISLKMKERHKFIMENISHINMNSTFIQNKNIDNFCLCLDFFDYLFILKNNKNIIVKTLHLFNFLITILLEFDKFNKNNINICSYNKLNKINNFTINYLLEISKTNKITEDIITKKNIINLLKIENKTDLLEKILTPLSVIIEIPDEFCDPIMYSTIINPVYIPVSNIIMDKSIIFTHLDSYQENPFSGDPLSKNDIIQYNLKPDIKVKINSFIKKRDDWFKKNNMLLE